MAEDYYKTLGIRRGASQAEIQKAYRELARKYHPDLNPDDEQATQKFQEVQKAFEVLNDSEKREMYDRYGSGFESMGKSGPRGGGPWTTGSGPEFSFEDLDLGQFFQQGFGGAGQGGAGLGGAGLGGGFGDIFSQFRQGAGAQQTRKRGSARRRGADVHHELPVPFTTAINGDEVQITVQRETGKTERISVKIPPGIEDGQKIRIRGQGEKAPRRGTPGDILITIRVAPHPSFQRRGNQLSVRVPVTLAEAALGAKIDVPTPKGVVTLSVPPGTSSGTKLRVKGHGVASANGPAGDLLAEMQIVLPDELDDADRKILQELDQRHLQNPRANLSW